MPPAYTGGMKFLTQHPLFIRVLAAVFALYGRLVFATCRVRVLTPLPAQLTQGPVVLAFWHTNICALPLLAKPNPAPLTGLMSASRDGTFTRTLARHFGVSGAVGSSHRKAVSGTRSLLRFAGDGNSLFLTPDGPRGPAHIAKKGATVIALQTGLPLIPCASACTRGHTFGSWDSVRLPYPFTTFYLAYGQALFNATPEALTAALNTLTAQAQAAARAGHNRT
jgi:hypothetical protein